MTPAEIALAALAFLTALALTALGAVLIVVALRLTRMRRIKPTGQALVFRNGRFEARPRVTTHDVRRATKGGDR
jgi:hypothetical protein